MQAAFKGGYAETAATASAKQTSTIQTRLNMPQELIRSH
jgi:hypothetical protein